MTDQVGGWTAEFAAAFGPASNDLEITARLGVIRVYSVRERKLWSFKESDSPSAAAERVKRDLSRPGSNQR
jgi:hypothetical protein